MVSDQKISKFFMLARRHPSKTRHMDIVRAPFGQVTRWDGNRKGAQKVLSQGIFKN
jgi:hypothetical protein